MQDNSKENRPKDNHSALSRRQFVSRAMAGYFPTLFAMILMIAQGGIPAGAAAQDAGNRALTRELHRAYDQLQLALQDQLEALDLLEQAQLAWLQYHSLDPQARAALPGPPGGKDAGQTGGWRAKLLEQRIAHLNQYFTSLPESDRLKAQRPRRHSENLARHPASGQLMAQWARQLNATPGGNQAAPGSGKEPAIKADQALNTAYQRVTSQLYKAHPDVKKKLVQSQLAWIRYRDLEAAFAAALPGEPKPPARNKRQQTLESLTAERTELLQRMFELLPESLKNRVRPPWPAVIRTLTLARDFRPLAEEKLPPGVLKISQIDFSGGKGMFSLEVDLNQDGAAELIVCYGGGSGGMGYIVYQKRSGKYGRIGEIFGFTLQLLSRKNGFFQIGTSTKSGAGDGEMELYQYRDGQYRLVRTDRFNQHRGYLGTDE